MKEKTEALPIPVAPRQRKKQRIAAYCRVSTLMACQETSISGQVRHYRQKILENQDWELADIYLEVGVTGTRTERRPELQRLLRDCGAGKIDLILTKSISRFARNTADCLEMVRRLTALGVAIRFEKEALDTGDMESEFLLTVLACLAEEESRSISGNMKWSIRRRFADGTYRGTAPYGYRWKEGVLTAEPAQAAVVREIFAMALAGKGGDSIAGELNSREIPSPMGKRWTQNSVRALLRNPAYMGDVLYQKTFRDDAFRQRRNRGELDRFYVENHHEGLVSRGEFEGVRRARQQRARAVGYLEDAEPCRSLGRYCFSGILRCGRCGAVMHRQTWKHARTCWICHGHTAGGCPMKPQPEEDMMAAFLSCLNKLAWAGNGRGNRVLDRYRAGPDEGDALRLLRRFLRDWQITDDPEAFPAEGFTRLVSSCTVEAGKWVVFHFRCGLSLRESLCRTRMEAGKWT